MCHHFSPTFTSIFSFYICSILAMYFLNTHTHMHAHPHTRGNEVGNVDQLTLKYNTITTDYTAMASTWFTESGITTLTVCF